MKYLKTYEGVKSKLDARIKAHSKSQDFIQGFFVIFTCSDYEWNPGRVVNKLILGKIINKEDEITSGDAWGHDRSVETYVKIDVIDILNDSEARNITHVANNIKKLNLLYKSSSQKSAKEEFKNIKELEPYSEWVLNNDIGKYNL